MSRHASITGLTLLCVVALVGCDTTKASPAPSSAPPITTPAPSAGPPSADASPRTGANVIMEPDRAQSADLGEAGGTVTATGSNGAVYTLQVPAGALAQPTTISLSPVSTVATMPPGATLDAGVQFAPDGLQLYAPATLTIKLPGGAGAVAVTGIAWRGDGTSLHPVPTSRDADTLTYSVLHFSGEGAGEEVPLEPVATCTTNDEQDDLLTDLASRGATSINAAGFRSVLQMCYSGFVAPMLSAGIEAAQTGVGSPSAEPDGFVAYSTWLGGLGLARRTLNDPNFTVAPELVQSAALGVKFLQAWYASWNRDCVSVKDQEWHQPVKFARGALAWTRLPAISWNVATRANRLDAQSLLDNLCVKVSIDPGRGYTAVAPGESGDITVLAGITIDNGPVRTASGAVRVRITETGSTSVIGDGVTNADGLFAVTTTWPDGANPVRFDILATLIDNESMDDTVIASIDVPTDIQRFDRITKNAERLSFTFDHGFDGWSSGTVGSRATSSTWGLVDHLSDGGGVMHLDGRGTGTRAKAWMYRSFALPTSATSLQFDVSAEVIAGSSSSVRVRIVVDGQSTTLLTAALQNPTNHLAFKRERLNISAWAGRRVAIYIEQNYDGLTGFDKEIYVDNVKIQTS